MNGILRKSGNLDGLCDDYFTIQMHYGGEIICIEDEDVCYFGGKVQYWDRVDPDCLSILELDGFLIDVGYLEHVKTENIEEYRVANGFSYYYRVNGERLKQGLVELRDDKELLAMGQAVMKDTKFVELYLIKRMELEGAAPEANARESSANAQPAGNMNSKTLVPKNKGEQRQPPVGVPRPEIQGDTESDAGSGFVDEENAFSDDEFDVEDSHSGGMNHNFVIDSAVAGDADSDCGDSDYLGSVHSSDDEGSSRKRFEEFNPSKDMENPHFSDGQIFRDFQTFKAAIRAYSIKNKFPLRFHRSDPQRVQVLCDKNCKWNIWASPTADKKAVQVKSIELTHGGCVLVSRHKWFDYKFIANKYLLRFEVDPKWGNESIMKTVEQDFHYIISRWTTARARGYALEQLRGLAEDQYRRLHDYCGEVYRTHPDSTIFVETEEENNFHRMYCCLGACKKGFAAGCRRIIFLDGCFLKTLHGGQLLSAVGIDANDGIFPIAYAMVGVENEDNWTWFLAHVISDLKIPQFSEKWTFMSDKQKGLVNALSTLVPYAEHRFCVRHLWSNLQRAQGGNKTTKDLFWAVARSSYQAEFDKCMLELEKYNEEAYNWLVEKPVSQRCRAYFLPNCKTDVLLNNHCESWNRSILGARVKPIISMFETIRCQLMIRFVKKKEFAENNFTSQFCPKILKKIQAAKDASVGCTALPSGSNTFQVRCLEGQVVVDLNQQTCTCRKWDLTGIPCSHAVCAIFSKRDKVESYVDKCYEVATYISTYNFTLAPMVGPESWRDSNKDPVIPPYVSIEAQSRKGRCKVARRKGKEEVLEEKEKRTRKYRSTNVRSTKKRGKIHCSQCGLEGHNKSVHRNEQGNASFGPQPAAGESSLVVENGASGATNNSYEGDTWYSGERINRIEGRHTTLAELATRVLTPKAPFGAGNGDLNHPQAPAGSSQNHPLSQPTVNISQPHSQQNFHVASSAPTNWQSQVNGRAVQGRGMSSGRGKGIRGRAGGREII